ncbi:hypothetical protein [Actinoallomurus sp. NPDC052274]|uniref:hypothetical protein n=1 Tax=Actinoallomurus sp. NPDC052274 TaxID=3155420 RepID=UPI0034247886
MLRRHPQGVDAVVNPAPKGEDVIAATCTPPDAVTRAYPLSGAVRAHQDLAGSHTRGELVVVADAEAAR